MQVVESTFQDLLKEDYLKEYEPKTEEPLTTVRALLGKEAKYYSAVFLYIHGQLYCMTMNMEVPVEGTELIQNLHTSKLVGMPLIRGG